MINTDKEDKEFLEQLEQISKKLDEMPEWKKNGWAILDEIEPYYCGIRNRL